MTSSVLLIACIFSMHRPDAGQVSLGFLTFRVSGYIRLVLNEVICIG